MRAWSAALLLACAACAGRPLAPPASAAAPVPEEAPAPVRRADRAELKRLYEAAVDAYAKEDLAESERLFRLMLERDPGNAAARKGLRRLSLEKPAP